MEAPILTMAGLHTQDIRPTARCEWQARARSLSRSLSLSLSLCVCVCVCFDHPSARRLNSIHPPLHSAAIPITTSHPPTIFFIISDPTRTHTLGFTFFHYLTFATLVMQYVNARHRPLLVWKQLQNVDLGTRNHELCLHGAVRKQVFLHGWLALLVGIRGPE